MTQLSVVFLGTGGSWPTVNRNVSCTAIKRGSEVLLFDCGEGSQRQIQQSSISYMQIHHIFITHFHGDHFLGLPGLMQTMQLNDREKPVHIYGPKGINELATQLLHLGYFRPAFPVIIHEVHSDDEITFDDYTVSALKVPHNVPTLAYCFKEKMRPGKFNKPQALKLGIPEGPLFSKLQKGQTITLKDGTSISPEMVLGPPRRGRKIVISGDTTSCTEMIAFASGADLLVHEATFDSELEDIAVDYGHTTARQAATIAKKAKVKKVYLTHISPRYLKKKVLEDDARSVFKSSYVPYDFDEVDVKLPS